MAENKNQPLEHEEAFFKSLRFIVTHFIKNYEGHFDEYIPIARAHEDKTWADYSIEKKREALKTLVTSLTGDDDVSKHFAEYPGKWSRSKFEEFKELLTLYYEELKQAG